MKLPRLRLRRLTLRRVTAAVLVLLAAALATRPAPGAPGTVPMLVTTRDLPPGTTLRASDLAVSRLPESLRPPAALTDPAQATGRVLAGATTVGEPLTRARLLGHVTSSDPATSAVPFRLADPSVAALLTPGVRVDVVTVSPTDTAAVVLAANATVLTVRPADSASEGRLVVLALPREEATRVAAASLGQPVAVTLR